MKMTRMLMVGLAVLAISPVLAATERCRSIQSDKERLACFDSEASAAQANKQQAKATKEPDGSTFVDPVESLKAENDKVSARLKGICRGC
jgi:hypothetical protein